MGKLTVRGISTHEESKGEWKRGYLIEDEGQSYIINGVVEANNEYISIGEWCSVDPETLGISTGLPDENGTEIFEGDILKGENGNLAIYRHPTLGFYTIDSSNFECFFADGVNVGVKEFNENLKYISEGLEVIGNVYENPELLEVGQ